MFGVKNMREVNYEKVGIKLRKAREYLNLTQEQVAEKLSVSQSFVANKLRLLRYNNEEREIILQNNLSERHARAILRIFDHEMRVNVLKQVVNKGLNVAKTEELVSSLINPEADMSATSSAKDRSYNDTTAFISAINRSIECAKNGNLNIKTRKIVGESYTEITIILPNKPKEAPSSEETITE